MKLSIITINRNNGQGLRDTLQSVASQRGFHDYEHIVIDGASTDSSLDVISEFSGHIAKAISEPDTGIYNAMNKGISKAEGDYLLFLNSGDILLPAILEKIDFADFHEDLIYGDLDFQEPDRIRHKEMPPPTSITSAFFMFNSLPHPATFIRRSLFEKFGVYDESMKIAADAKFFFTVVNSGEAALRKLPFTISVFKTDGISSNPKFAALRREECRSYLSPVFGDEVFRREELLVERTQKLKDCNLKLRDSNLKLRDCNRKVEKYRTLVRDATFNASLSDDELAEDILRMSDLMLAIRKTGIGRWIIRKLSNKLAARERRIIGSRSSS